MPHFSGRRWLGKGEARPGCQYLPTRPPRRRLAALPQTHAAAHACPFTPPFPRP